MTGRSGLPYFNHPMEVMGSVVTLPEKIVAMAHDYGEFRDIEELAELNVPKALLDRIRLLTKSFPDNVPESDPRYCEYIWNLLGDPVCLKIKYYDLQVNNGHEESPAKNGKRRTGRYPRVLNILQDIVLNNQLYFCSRTLYFNVFSNFFEEPIEIDGVSWKSGEHYYQAAKFAEDRPHVDPRYFDEIRDASTPSEAKLLADTFSRMEASQQTEYRLAVMEKMLRVKFAPGTRMHSRLIQTGNIDLVHESEKDLFWGQTRSGEGQNLLGHLLMQIRRESQNDI